MNDIRSLKHGDVRALQRIKRNPNITALMNSPRVKKRIEGISLENLLAAFDEKPVKPSDNGQ
jgi:hypothetical protein